MIGIVYLMIHVPLIVFCKIGITGKTASGRAKQIDRAVWGFPVPVMVMFLPFPRYFEKQIFHRMFEPLSARFYKGDGSTEWFWFPAGVVVLGIGLAYWWAVDFAVWYFAGFSIVTFLTEIIWMKY